MTHTFGEASVEGTLKETRIHLNKNHLNSTDGIIANMVGLMQCTHIYSTAARTVYCGKPLSVDYQYHCHRIYRQKHEKQEAHIPVWRALYLGACAVVHFTWSTAYLYVAQWFRYTPPASHSKSMGRMAAGSLAAGNRHIDVA